MDAVPIDIQAEIAPSACRDVARSREAVEAALRDARAPGGATGRPWTLEVRISREGRTTTAAAHLLDGDGRPRGDRTLTSAATGCEGLARAAGTWGALVADEALAREDEPRDATSPPEAARTHDEAAFSAPLLGIVEAPPPDAPEGPPRRGAELGAHGLLATGHGVGPLTGASLFVAADVGASWFVRGAGTVAAGLSRLGLPAGGEDPSASSTLWLVRGDLCRRIPGNYIEKRGIQLDLCGGVEAGALRVADGTSRDGAAVDGGTRGRAGVGPSATLRGEIGGGVAVELRGESSLSLVRPELLGARPAFATAAALVGLSVRLP